ncbi:MAG: hypothetical protein ACHQF0_14890 [Chitinophagales bacterium]
MKNKILVLTTAILFLVAIFTACKKEKGSSTDTTATEASTQSDDQARVSNETEAVANDADASLEAYSSFSGRLDHAQTNPWSCDASLAFDSVSDPMTVTITYSGTCLGTRTRTGSVVLSMAKGTHWKDANASISITFNTLKITRVSDNKSITLNGTLIYTNVNGGLLINLPILGTVTHTLTSSGMSITFDDNTQRTWQIARQRLFTWDNSDNSAVVSVSGTHTDGADTNISEWGLNRLGHAFATSTVQPIVIRQDCAFRIVSGEVKHVTPLVTANTTFGLDATGNPTSCPGTGHYYFKIVWTGAGGNSVTLIMPY